MRSSLARLFPGIRRLLINALVSIPLVTPFNVNSHRFVSTGTAVGTPNGIRTLHGNGSKVRGWHDNRVLQRLDITSPASPRNRVCRKGPSSKREAVAAPVEEGKRVEKRAKLPSWEHLPLRRTFDELEHELTRYVHCTASSRNTYVFVCDAVPTTSTRI